MAAENSALPSLEKKKNPITILKYIKIEELV